MRERLALILERLCAVPSERAVPEPFCGFFTDTAKMLLGGGTRGDTAYAEERMTAEPDAGLSSDPAERRAGLCREEENFGEKKRTAADWEDPVYAARLLGDTYGPLLSAVYYELLLIRYAAGGDLMHPADETWTCMLIELFLELYGEFSCEEIPGVRTVERIFADYLTDYLPEYEERETACLLAVHPEPSPERLPLVLMTPGLIRRAADVSERPEIVLAHAGDIACVLDTHFPANRKRVLQESLDAGTGEVDAFCAMYPDPISVLTERSGWLYAAGRYADDGAAGSSAYAKASSSAQICRLTERQRAEYDALGQELIEVFARYLS